MWHNPHFALGGLCTLILQVPWFPIRPVMIHNYIPHIVIDQTLLSNRHCSRIVAMIEQALTE